MQRRKLFNAKRGYSPLRKGMKPGWKRAIKNTAASSKSQISDMIGNAARGNQVINNFASKYPGAYKAGVKMVVDGAINSMVNNMDKWKSPIGITSPIGVLQSKPSGLVSVKNNGTQISKSYHLSGKDVSNSSWIKEGQQYTFLRSAPTDTFSVTATVAKRGQWATRLIGEAYLRTNFYEKFFAGSGSESSTSSPVYLAQSAATGDFYLKDTTVKTYITSSTNANVTLYIYEIVCKLTDIDNTNTILGTPLEAWQQGLTYAFTNSTNSPDRKDYGMSMLNSKFFRTFYAIEKTYKIDLPAGASHLHTSTYNHNYVFPACRFYQSDETNFHGLTRFIVFDLHTYPGNNDNPTTPLVSFTAGSVDVVQSIKTTAYAKTNQNKFINVDYNPDSSATGLKVTTQSDIGDVNVEDITT